MKSRQLKLSILSLFAASASMAEVVDVTGQFTVAGGFKVEKIHAVKKDQGSWVALTKDGSGRLIAADQYGGLFRITVPSLEGGETRVEPLQVPLTGAHGLLWHKGTLYVSINETVKGNKTETGVWAVEETAAGWAEPELLKSVKAGGEHGIHALIPSPDEKWIYVVTGNYARVPEISDSFPARVWEEDQLLQRNPDGRGHASRVMAPGGWIARFRPDGSDWQLVAIGQRNTYDIAFHDSGALFNYDADMEWDFGMPWYRPTRITHIVPGAEMGWRNGSGKWPAYYEDSTPPAVNIGPGSPTGLLAGRGFKAPAKYQRAIYAFDWTFATIYAVHLSPDGASFSGKTEEFVAGSGLPLTDAVIGDDGAMYFATGGRRGKSHLWRVIYTGNEPTAPQPAKPVPHPERERLAGYIRNPEAIDVDFTLARLASDDRMLRFMARAALERAPESGWIEKIPAQDSAWQKILGSMALARLDAEKHRQTALASLLSVEWPQLSPHQQINWLRSLGLVFIRGGEPSPQLRLSVLEKIDSSYPAADRHLNMELARMLCYLEAPEVVARTLRLMDQAPAEQAAGWMKLVNRNSRYGKAIDRMIENHPPTTQIHYLYCLRAVEGPWKTTERRRVFNWFREIEGRSGGNSYAGNIAKIRSQIFDNCTPEEKKLFASEAKAPKKKPEPLPPVKGPGRVWTVGEIVEATAGKLENRDLKNGKAMFKASLCSACHKFGPEGGAQGPDLTNLAGRFTVGDLARSIAKPDEVISDQYEFTRIKTHDGKTTTGRILSEKDEILVIGINPFDFSQQIEISRADIDEMSPSPVSPMPPGMVNRLNPDELRDLFAYLLRK